MISIKEHTQVSFKDYWEITKPGIIFSNTLGTIAGFCIAARNYSFSIEFLVLFLWTVLGTMFVIASSAIINNVYDSDIDKHMERTKNRALTNGRIKQRNALILSAFLIVLGEVILLNLVNVESALAGFIGFIFYAFVYTISKRKTVLNTEIGCISGAMPPVIGYVAVTGQFDYIALILFVFMFAWQPPHFFALAIRRTEEYKSVGVPMLPIIVGFKRTKIHMLIYAIMTVLFSVALYTMNVVDLWFLVVSLLLGSIFIGRSIQGFSFKTKEEDISWAKKMFGFSIIYITLMFISMMFVPIF